MWIRFFAFRAAILSDLELGVPETSFRIVQARHLQRLIAEELYYLGEIQGIAEGHEGDYKREQRIMAKVFDEMPAVLAVEAHDAGKPPHQIIKMKSLQFKMKAGGIGAIVAPKPQITRVEMLRAETKAATHLNRPESSQEGSEGVDYIEDYDPASGVHFYRPINGKGGTKDADQNSSRTKEDEH